MTRGADERVVEVLDQELRSPAAFDPQALAAAVELLRSPRREWAVPRGEWEQLAVSLAIAVLRVEGWLGTTRVRAVARVRAALMDMERRKP